MTSSEGSAVSKSRRILLDCSFPERRRRAIALLWLAGRATARERRPSDCRTPQNAGVPLPPKLSSAMILIMSAALTNRLLKGWSCRSPLEAGSAARRGAFPRRAPHAGTTERLLANRLGHTLEPAFDFEQQVTVWNRRCPGRLTLRGFEPDLYRIKPQWVSLPADGKRSFQDLKTFFEGKHWRVRLYIARPLSLDFGCVCAGEPRNKRKQALPFSLSCAVI